MTVAVPSRLGLDEMEAAAAVHRASRDERLPWLAGRHTPDEDRRFFRERVFPSCELWGTRVEGTLIGIVAFRRDWIDHLYVLPGRQGHGIGSSLLQVAKGGFPRLQLWTFKRNLQARDFYAARGFSLVRETDGAGNEEREPDCLYLWSTEIPQA